MSFKIEKHHPLLDDIISPESSLEKIQGGFRFLEGPAWHPYEAHLVFSDILGNALFRLTEGNLGDDHTIDLIRENSYLANGNTYDRQGRLLSCEHGTSRVTRLEADGSQTIVASHYQGKELNSPNDIVVSSKGIIFFTDPNSGRSIRYGIPREQELGFQGVYALQPPGKMTIVVDDFSKPNGLCLSLDETRLFVNDTDRQHIRVFDLTTDLKVKNEDLWAELIGDEPGVADGMKLDSKGNLYCCGPGGIHIFNPNAELLGRILTPEVTANFAWGGKNLSTMYLTASTGLYRLAFKIPGLALF
ncbi:MAG: SMP-30/gluconolactonase/LRE family protein [Desulfobacteraceae bacterium]|nr:MAG: SMP-30/gluconolactonase/LRE family protein [Desulfobacteraceae bacterium]